jgi:hypothetical protein
MNSMIVEYLGEMIRSEVRPFIPLKIFKGHSLGWRNS